MRIDVATVLLVEDSPTQREICATFIGHQGCRILTAENGADAFDIFKRDKVDLVITDLNMPVMDGLTLLKKIKACSLAMPKMILITGCQEFSAQDGLEFGFDEVLLKPFQPADFVAAVRKALDGAGSGDVLLQSQNTAPNFGKLTNPSR